MQMSVSEKETETARLRAAFDALGVARGPVTRERLINILTQTGNGCEPLSREQAEMVFDGLDKNRDGKVARELIIAAWLERESLKENLIQATETNDSLLAVLAKLDEPLAHAMSKGVIRLLSVSSLRTGGLERAERRQDIEARERETGGNIFLPRDAAAAALRAGRRKVAFLTYGWRTREHPDPDGLTLAAIVALLNDPAGAHIEGVFWDFMCLYQKPRMPAEEDTFRAGLSMMADGYASPLGTTVLRRRAIPECPPHIKPAEYNDRPYDERGWCIFESAVSDEALARVAYFPKLKARLEASLPPKLIEIGEGPSGVDYSVVPPLAAAPEGARPRIQKNQRSILGAKFTGKGDQKVVARMYDEYRDSLTHAMYMVAAATGEKVAASYEGKRSSRDEMTGHGVLYYTNGNRFEGEFVRNKRCGFGVSTYASGDVYEGEYRDDEKSGRGAHHYNDGDLFIGTWRADKREGAGTKYYRQKGTASVRRYSHGIQCDEGVLWSADRQSATLLVNGRLEEAISLEQAGRIAKGLGLPVPPVGPPPRPPMALVNAPGVRKNSGQA